ncbi:Hypothetical protein NCS54_01126900 [Fusarium falciforme]|uniref:Hypothetical protein n=1 Tax=Fusarium falciforme TaxID=195108 RepID=UPI002301EB6C|nr:Hypothetical protein NCS54_01126900 [Fusarium falciforme]WAO93714.1 Hypothetical protein NCS54_01126900 [Fusarium falciforme]
MSTLTMSDAPPPTATVIATTSDPRSPLLIAWDVVSAVFRFAYSFNWSLYISRLFRVLSFPFRLILIPLGFVKNVILVLLAPLFYIISYSLAGVRAVVDFLVSLEPLYTFFGAAAGVGIFAGIALAICSSLITTHLGMQDDDTTSERLASKQSLTIDTSSRRDSSGNELEWQWLDSPSHRRRPAGGLLSQTIHEEDDDSEY